MGRPFRASMPNTAEIPANKIVISNVITMNAGQGVRRLAADVERVVDRGHPVLHQVSGKASDDATDQHDQRNFVVMESDFFREAFDRERAIRVDLLVARLVGLVSSVDQCLG